MIYSRPIMSTQTVRLHRWDEIALEKVTEMLSRKVVTGEREMIAQIYLKRGCLVPMHSHESEQMTYILQGALRFHIGGEEITVREGEVLHIPSWVEHQAEALEDTFELDVFSPIRQALLAVAENYPNLKSNDNVKMLQEELSSTENKVGFARQFYNDIATKFNIAQQVFPTNVFANMFGFKPAELFEITEAADREVPVVDLSRRG